MPKKKLIKPTAKALARAKKKEQESIGKKAEPTTIQPTPAGVTAAKKKEIKAKKKKASVKKKEVKRKTRRSI